MKPLKISFTVIAIACAIACKKPTVTSLNVSMDDAAAIFTGASSLSTYGANGITADIANAAQAAATPNGCGLTKTDTLSHKSAIGSSASYSYVLYNSHKLNCNTGGQPDNVSGTITYSGNYNNPSLTFSNTGTTTYTLAGLTQTATVYSLTGEYKSSGTFKIKSDTTKSGTLSIDIMLKGLTISKSTLYITGGSATAIVTGNTPKHGDFTYNGTMTFTSASMATLVINGTTYTLNLVTGSLLKN